MTGTHPLTVALTQGPTQPGQYRLRVAVRAIPLAPGLFRCFITVPVLKPDGTQPIEILVYGTVLAAPPGR